MSVGVMEAIADLTAFWIGWTVIFLGGASLFSAIVWFLVHRIGVRAMKTARELGAQARFFTWYRRVGRLKVRGNRAAPPLMRGPTPPKRRAS